MDSSQFVDVELAVENKGELVKLIHYFAIEQTEDYLFPCKLVESDGWTEEIHREFWDKYWEGDFDRLGWNVCECFEEFYGE